MVKLGKFGWKASYAAATVIINDPNPMLIGILAYFSKLPIDRMYSPKGSCSDQTISTVTYSKLEACGQCDQIWQFFALWANF